MAVSVCVWGGGGGGGGLTHKTPGPLTFVFSWRAWFMVTTWGRIEVEPA